MSDFGDTVLNVWGAAYNNYKKWEGPFSVKPTTFITFLNSFNEDLSFIQKCELLASNDGYAVYQIIKARNPK